MSKGGMDLTAGAHLVANIGKAVKGADEGKRKGLLVAGEHVLGVSNAQVPHEEGDLAGSGAVSQAEDDGTTAVSYDTPYAVRQHEDQSLRHDAGRNAKYLENALNSERDKVRQIVATAIRKAVGL